MSVWVTVAWQDSGCKMGEEALTSEQQCPWGKAGEAQPRLRSALCSGRGRGRASSSDPPGLAPPDCSARSLVEQWGRCLASLGASPDIGRCLDLAGKARRAPGTSSWTLEGLRGWLQHHPPPPRHCVGELVGVVLSLLEVLVVEPGCLPWAEEVEVGPCLLHQMEPLHLSAEGCTVSEQEGGLSVSVARQEHPEKTATPLWWRAPPKMLPLSAPPTKVFSPPLHPLPTLNNERMSSTFFLHICFPKTWQKPDFFRGNIKAFPAELMISPALLVPLWSSLLASTSVLAKSLASAWPGFPISLASAPSDPLASRSWAAWEKISLKRHTHLNVIANFLYSVAPSSTL